MLVVGVGTAAAPALCSLAHMPGSVRAPSHAHTHTHTRNNTLQALLGFEHRVPHLDGHLVVLKGAGVTPHGAFTSACLQLSPAIALMVVVCSKHNNLATQVQNNGIAGKACQSRITHGSVHTCDSPTITALTQLLLHDCV